MTSDKTPDETDGDFVEAIESIIHLQTEETLSDNQHQLISGEQDLVKVWIKRIVVVLLCVILAGSLIAELYRLSHQDFTSLDG